MRELAYMEGICGNLGLLARVFQDLANVLCGASAN